jgi:type I restriction enzyme, S subunit
MVASEQTLIDPSRGHKQTEAGPIPQQWDSATVGDSMRLINGRAFKPSDWQSAGLPIIRIQNLNDDEAPFNRFSGPVQDRHLIQKSDLLFAWSGTLGTSFGVRVWDRELAVLNQHIFKVEPKEELLSKSFCFWALKQVQVQIERQAHGFKASFVHVKKTDLVEVHLAIPPLAEQEAIAEVLSDADEAIRAVERLLAKKRAVKQATLQTLLSGQTRLPGFEEDWQESKLADICWYQEGPGVRNHQFTAGGVKLLNGTNISRGRLELDSTTRHVDEGEAFGRYAHFLADEGDLVIASSGVTIDKFEEKIAFVRRTDLPLCMNTSTIRFKPHQHLLVNDYLAALLSSSFFKDQIGGQATGSAQLNFGPSHLNRIIFRLPSLQEQKEISIILRDMSDEIDTQDERLRKLRAIKQGMMQELLTGRTRLV